MMFLKPNVGIGCAVIIFHSYKPTGSINTIYLLAATKQYITNKEHARHYRRCCTYEHQPGNNFICRIQNTSSCTAPNLGYVVSTFVSFSHFSASWFFFFWGGGYQKRFLNKKRVYCRKRQSAIQLLKYMKKVKCCCNFDMRALKQNRYFFHFALLGLYLEN